MVDSDQSGRILRLLRPHPNSNQHKNHQRACYKCFNKGNPRQRPFHLYRISQEMYLSNQGRQTHQHCTLSFHDAAPEQPAQQDDTGGGGGESGGGPLGGSAASQFLLSIEFFSELGSVLFRGVLPRLLFLKTPALGQSLLNLAGLLKYRPDWISGTVRTSGRHLASRG